MSKNVVSLFILDRPSLKAIESYKYILTQILLPIKFPCNQNQTLTAVCRPKDPCPWPQVLSCCQWAGDPNIGAAAYDAILEYRTSSSASYSPVSTNEIEIAVGKEKWAKKM